ncbi:hypothetical protein L3V83_12525 [Thiotrichales bacterium 19X7-9]|nr:hypothetical protein [Thiotrichales bacterium 19X7-9]
MENYESWDCYFKDWGTEVLVNKVYTILGVHKRNTKDYQLHDLDFNNNAGILEFQVLKRDKIKLGDLVEIKELKFVVENIKDLDNGIMIATLSDYKASDEYIDFDV